MGKRSPILGYNHNVRYRGLVFHVQTEDSGVASPHLFTHLFHSGVIVSSRKLVYDAGSAEESIKSLMQAQHKATLKDLRRGHFDDKIDSYLGGTPGLLPRGAVDPGGVDPDAPVAPEPAPEPVSGVVEEVAIGAPTEQALPMMDLSEPVMITERPPTRPLIPPPPLPRSVTERALAQSLGRGTPTSVDTTLKTEIPVFADGDATQAVPQRAERSDSAARRAGDGDDAPEIEIQLELDDAEHDGDDAIARTQQQPPRRNTRDTELQAFDQNRPTLDSITLDEHTRPTLGIVHEEARRPSTVSDGVPGAIRASSPAIPPPPPAVSERKTSDRPSTINASALPPARPISRPASRPALSQPQVVSRPITSDDRSRRESEAVEVYSPAPPSAELPGERPGQYAQHKKTSTRIPIEGLKAERSGGVAIPAGLGRPARSPTAAPANRPGTSPPVNVDRRDATPAPAAPTPAPHSDSQRINLSEPARPRAVTPPRVAPPVAASAPRAASPSASSGVVMTRPAVIVGAPRSGPAPAATVPRIRKAREDEGRGFGQGLISEKSLDEVILAYLSEDADDK